MRKGFTIVELMIIVSVIGIFSAIAIPNFQEFKKKQDPNYINNRKKERFMRECLRNLKATDCRDNWKEYHEIY